MSADPKTSLPGEAEPLQRTRNEDLNASFFENWADYHHLVESIDTYRLSARALVGELSGRVVDVGGGGVVNYDCAAISELVCVDIAAPMPGGPKLPDCARPVLGSAVELPLPDATYDGALMQMLVHHLAERDFATTRERVLSSFREAARVLKPGGKLVILESVMYPPLEWLERLCFPLTRRLLGRMGHPLVFQWSPGSLARLLAEAGLVEVQVTLVPRGRWMIFLGRRMPTWLVPVRFAKLSARRPR
jgi:ubiquinone/menaquinone biosynthesis C-methylase UbiE